MPQGKRGISGAVMARREKVAEATIRGYGEAEIAKSLSVTKATISMDLIWLRQQWLEAALDKAPEWKALLIQGQVKIIKECWAAWERSKKNRQTRRTKRPGPDGVMEEVTETEEGQVGDPKYFDQIHKAQSELAKLTGAYEPFQTRIVDEQGKDILSRLVDTLSVDELRTYDATLKKLEALEQQRRLAKVIDVESKPVSANGNGHSGNGSGKANGKTNGKSHNIDSDSNHNQNGNGKPVP